MGLSNADFPDCGVALGVGRVCVSQSKGHLLRVAETKVGYELSLFLAMSP
jgi:hypothetical protein